MQHSSVCQRTIMMSENFPIAWGSLRGQSPPQVKSNASLSLAAQGVRQAQPALLHRAAMGK